MDRAKQMMEYDQVLGEQTLFHGTRTNKPEAIFKGDASFDMRYCHSGLWGRGNYFAVNASYSNDYAHIEAGGVRQMLVAYVLTGHSYHCHSDSTITQPPFRGHQGEMMELLDVGMTVFVVQPTTQKSTLRTTTTRHIQLI